MPVKVRCRDCDHQFSVPDAARGKSVKCKECGKPVKIPTGDAEPKKKAKPAEKTIDDEDFFSKLDLDNVEHADKRICPKCAQDVTDEDIECPHCGVNLETGLTSDKQKEKQKLRKRGPDPDLFFKVALPTSWEFVKANKGLGLRLAMFWSFAATLHLGTNFMAQYTEKLPLQAFFGTLALISWLASIGCFYQLCTEIIKLTMDEKDKMDRFNFDFFSDVALGLKAVVWPFALYGIVLLPVGAVVSALLKFDLIPVENLALPAAGLAGAVLLFSIPFLPTSLCHMSAKYTYKAYLPNEMFQITFRNLKAISYWWLIVIVLNLLAIAIAIPLLIFGAEVFAGLSWVIFKTLELCSIDILPDNRGFLYYVTFPVIGMVTMGLFLFLYSLSFSFSALFAMKAVALLCFYNRGKLQMGDRRVALQPAPFWMRYLAYMVDQTLIAIFVFVVWLGFFLLNMFVDKLGVEGFGDTIGMLAKVVMFAVPFVYYIFSESGPGGATLGKNALGMQVVNKDGKKPITIGEAMMRAIGRNIGSGLFGLGLAMCAWDPEKRTLHDKMTKTRVVWRPENS